MVTLDQRGDVVVKLVPLADASEALSAGSAFDAVVAVGPSDAFAAHPFPASCAGCPKARGW